MSDEKHETIADIVDEMRQAEATWHRSEIAQLPTQYLKEWSDRIEAAHQREVAELKHWIKSSARWIKCHDIYHTSGSDLIKQAKEILNDNGEFLFKKEEQ